MPRGRTLPNVEEAIQQMQADQVVRVPSNTTFNTPNYGTGMAHIILAGTSGWAIHATTYKREPIAFGCFVYVMGHSLLGVLSHTHPNVSDYIRTLYNQSFMFTQTLPLALINIQLHQNYRQPLEYIHWIALSATIPPICDLILPTSNSVYVSDVIQLANVASIGYLGATFKKYWISGMALLAGINHFVVKYGSGKFHVKKVDLHTVGLGFLIIFAVKSIKESKDLLGSHAHH